MIPSHSQWIGNLNKLEEDKKRKRAEYSPDIGRSEKLIIPRTKNSRETKLHFNIYKPIPVPKKNKAQSNKNFIKLLLLIIGISLIAVLNINVFSFMQKCALLISICTLTASTYLYNKNAMKEIKKDFPVKDLASFSKREENIVLNERTSIEHGSRRYPMSNGETTKIRK